MGRKSNLITKLALGVTVGLLVAPSAYSEQSGAAGYAGSATCAECHKDQAVSGAHAAKTDPRSPAAKYGCESCHGPAAEHARNQEEGKENDPTLATMRLGAKSTLSPEDRNAVCLQCHSNGHTALWQGSTHQRRNLSCSDCHSVHSKNANLLAGTEPEVCATCHKDIRAQLMRNSHHPIREGKLNCSDCHNVHGAVADGLINANYLNEKCYECHAEKRGPFLWDHAPVVENCMACHTAHGSIHDKLLRQKEPYLCQTCHSNSRHPGTLYAIPEGAPSHSAFKMLNNRAFYRACQNCHVAIHGSNHPSGKSLAR